MYQTRFPLSVLLAFMSDVIDEVDPLEIEDYRVSVQPIYDSGNGSGVCLGLERCIADD